VLSVTTCDFAVQGSTQKNHPHIHFLEEISRKLVKNGQESHFVLNVGEATPTGGSQKLYPNGKGWQPAPVQKSAGFFEVG